jgi:hypothetical protein
MHSELYQTLTPGKHTLYKGRLYRTRAEAKWAVVLDRLGVPFYYQPSHYRLPSGTYLPDFWLPTLDAYLEVKPCDVVDPRYSELGEMRAKRVFVASGNMPQLPQGWSEQEVYPALMGHMWLKWPEDAPNYMLAREAQGRVNIVPVAYGSTANGADPEILTAYIAASSYSFSEE